LIVALVLLAGSAPADTLDYTDWTIRLAVQDREEGTDGLNSELNSRGLKVLYNSLFDDNQTVADYLLINPQIGRRLERQQFQASQSGTRFLSDGTVTTEYGIRLTGTVLQALMPRTGGGVPVGPMSCPTCGQPWPEDREVPPGITLVPTDEEAPSNCTGVLVDARGLELNFALFPRILNEDGRIVYGPEFFIPTYAAERGAVGYYSNVGSAAADDRVGFNPIRVTALRAAGRNSTDLIITNSDARRLHGSLESLRLLERCRVVVLTD
jgi:hypothetical protein